MLVSYSTRDILIYNVIRTIEWEKARASLRSILHTFVPSEEEEYEKLAAVIEPFIRTMDELME
jgi:hypothetical protein